MRILFTPSVLLRGCLLSKGRSSTEHFDILRPA